MGGGEGRSERFFKFYQRKRERERTDNKQEERYNKS